jgi:hypothetical protein
MEFLTNRSPAEGEKFVPLDTLIEFTIIDDGKGLSPSSLIVEVNGFRAIENLSFVNGFDGPLSDITINLNDIVVIIDPEQDFKQGDVVNVKVQIKNNVGGYNNANYVFKTIPKEPYLSDSNPKSGDVLDSDQVLFFKFTDPIDGVNAATVNVNLNGLPIIINSEFQDFYDGPESAITKIGNDLFVRIDPTEAIRNGTYALSYSVEDTIGNKLYGNISYSVKLNEVILPSIFPQTKPLGVSTGLYGVFNVGTGDALKVEWHKPTARSYKGEAFALIYQNLQRLATFDGNPKYIAKSTVTSAIFRGLTPGITLAHGVRSFETYKDSFDLTGMEEVDTDVFVFPNPVTLVDYIVDSINTTFVVDSAIGYPAAGVLIVNNSEVVRYTSRTNNSFIVPNKFRGLNNTSKGIYLGGDTLQLFVACQDKNTVITTVTPVFVDGYESGRIINNIGLVVTDYTDSDRKFFQGFDFCGYHRALPQDTLTGKDDCGSYLGGEFNGTRGMNIFDRMNDRQEVLLDQTGEPVILLKRIWNGQICSCMDSRRVHPKMRSCKTCYGTGYEGGFQQFDYMRRRDRRVMVKFGDTEEDLKLGAQNHLEQSYEPQCWTLFSPAIRDRDLIIRFDYVDQVEYFYEVLRVNREKAFYRHFTRQRLFLKRLDKTDIVYTFPFVLKG